MTAAVSFYDVTLPSNGFAELERQATAEGHTFLARMQVEWSNDTNRFANLGECLLGAHLDATLVAVGGLNRDPYTNNARIGRLRHIYVHADHRRSGIASRLVRELVVRNTHFETIRLRTPNADASRFYENLGFTAIADTTATHTLVLT